MKNFVKEFKEFVSRGNVVDLAVGVVIGAAFGKIVSSLVEDIIMPPIGFLLKGVDFKNLKFIMKPAETIGDKLSPEVAINYGKFIQTFIDFIIIAFAIFIAIKALNAFQKKLTLTKKAEEAIAEAPQVKTDIQIQTEVLMEIKELLNNK